MSTTCSLTSQRLKVDLRKKQRRTGPGWGRGIVTITLVSTYWRPDLCTVYWLKAWQKLFSPQLNFNSFIMMSVLRGTITAWYGDKWNRNARPWKDWFVWLNMQKAVLYPAKRVYTPDKIRIIIKYPDHLVKCLVSLLRLGRIHQIHQGSTERYPQGTIMIDWLNFKLGMYILLCLNYPEA